MHNRQRFYTSAHGNDDSALPRIIKKVLDLEQELGNVSRIVFIAHGLQNDGWLRKSFGDAGIKELLKGTRLSRNSALNAKFESLRTFRAFGNEVLITLGLESDEILKLDDNYNIKAIFALPWLVNSVDKWARITNAINIENNQPAASFPNPPCIAIKALTHLTESINMSSGLSCTSDNNLAKTYLRTLAKYEVPLRELEIESYLIKDLNWDKEYADDLIDIIKRINEGRSFQGGDKTGLQNHYKRWKDECNE